MAGGNAVGQYPPQFTGEQFDGFLKEKLGDDFDKARDLFGKYSEGANGADLSFKLVNALLQAADRGKVPEVVAELKRHWDEDLSYQHPEIRGTIGSALAGQSHTDIAFQRIHEEILGLNRT